MLAEHRPGETGRGDFEIVNQLNGDSVLITMQRIGRIWRS